MNVRTYDISLGISPEMPVWPGDPPVMIERVREIAKGANANVSRLDCGVHVGTHVDAPVHFIDGSSGVEAIPLRVLIGRAYVVHLPHVSVIDENTLEGSGIPPRTRRVLFKTSNSNYWADGERKFKKDFVAIDASGASWLVRKKVKLVGVDYLSVAPFKASRETHHILLENGVVIVEGLDLSEVNQGRYKLYCLPLKIIGSDGAPARAILVGV
ncbi:MAG: cyclase family protein [Anaerolineaceae bacterium]|nr:MAG: cyclase family protein [Anaerolineaceae bacterium]